MKRSQERKQGHDPTGETGEGEQFTEYQDQAEEQERQGEVVASEAEVLATQPLRLQTGPRAPYPTVYTAPDVQCFALPR